MVIDFISIQDVSRIHDNVIAQYGGLAGIRDYNLLASAVAQPQMFIFGSYIHVGIFDMAAAYFFHIIKNHPFLDGNKRTGVLATLTFLEKNGIIIETDFDSLVNLALETASADISKEHIAQFLKQSAINTQHSYKG